VCLSLWHIRDGPFGREAGQPECYTRLPGAEPIWHVPPARRMLSTPAVAKYPSNFCGCRTATFLRWVRQCPFLTIGFIPAVGTGDMSGVGAVMGSAPVEELCAPSETVSLLKELRTHGRRAPGPQRNVAAL